MLIKECPKETQTEEKQRRGGVTKFSQWSIYGTDPKCSLFCEERGKREKKKLKERKEATTGGDRDLVATRA